MYFSKHRTRQEEKAGAAVEDLRNFRVGKHHCLHYHKSSPAGNCCHFSLLLLENWWLPFVGAAKVMLQLLKKLPAVLLPPVRDGEKLGEL